MSKSSPRSRRDCIAQRTLRPLEETLGSLRLHSRELVDPVLGGVWSSPN
jgi:hypothetical protein